MMPRKKRIALAIAIPSIIVIIIIITGILLYLNTDMFKSCLLYTSPSPRDTR